MFNIISKDEYFTWLEKGIADKSNYALKGIQDAWILSQLGDKKKHKICEVGGGNSRVLAKLTENNECWNIDKFEGHGAGPTKIKYNSKIKIVKAFMGDFSDKIPSDYFDYVFSISVVEHIPDDQLLKSFKDISRVLKVGGLCFAAIDLYLGNNACDTVARRIQLYLDIGQDAEVGLNLLNSPVINKDIKFSCSFATNSDITMHKWNSIAPKLKEVRANNQSVSIKAVWEKR